MLCGPVWSPGGTLGRVEGPWLVRGDSPQEAADPEQEQPEEEEQQRHAPRGAAGETMLAATRASNVRVILRTPYDETDPAEWLSSRAGVPVVELPATVNREAAPGALAAYFDDVLSRLEKAIGQR